MSRLQAGKSGIWVNFPAELRFFSSYHAQIGHGVNAHSYPMSI